MLNSKKNNPVMKIIIIILIIIAFWVMLEFVNLIPPKLKEFQFEEENFALLFFNTPYKNESLFEHQDFKMEGSSFSSKAGGVSLIMVYFDLSEEILAQYDMDKIMDIIIEKQQESLNVDTRVTKEEILSDQFKGYRVQFQIDKDYMAQHFYFHNNRIFNSIAVNTNPFNNNQKIIDDYLYSFRVIE